MNPFTQSLKSKTSYRSFTLFLSSEEKRHKSGHILGHLSFFVYVFFSEKKKLKRTTRANMTLENKKHELLSGSKQNNIETILWLKSIFEENLIQ